MSETGKTTMAKNKAGQLVSWRHPGGKLLRLGAESLSDAELTAVIIGSGVAGLSAQEIADEIFKRFQSFRGLAGQPTEKLRKIKGMKTVKIVRLMAMFEIAKRIVDQVLEDYEQTD